MAIEGRAGAQPLWIIINNLGFTAGGAKMYTYSSLVKTDPKAVYYDQALSIPYTNPIQFGLNGSVPTPFYFKYDPDNLDDTYYIEVYDSDDNLLWTLDNYSPGEGGGGGSGSGASYVPLNNMVANGAFLDNVGNQAQPLLKKDIYLAPSNHVRFTPNTLNPVIPALPNGHGIVGPDIWFTKNNLNGNDSISFVDFPAGSDPLIGDVTPLQYIQYICGNAPTDEQYKNFQFPINAKVNNLDNQAITVTLWARTGSGTENINIYLRQYFGSGGSPSPEAYTLIGTPSLTNTWTKYTINATVPNTAGKTLGLCGDDALYLCIGMPLGGVSDIRFCKPGFWLGSLPPGLNFTTYDQTNAVIQSPRTGDVKFSMDQRVQSGWLSMDGRSIGSATSGATNRANSDTFYLYKTLWDGVINNYAPVTGGRGGSAVEDFAANKPMLLTRALGRMLMGGAPSVTSSVAFTSSATDNTLQVADSSIFVPLMPILIDIGGTSGLPADIIYVAEITDATHIKVAVTEENAQNGVIATVVNGTGTILPANGIFVGEGRHTLTINEMPAHNHPGSTVTYFVGSYNGGNNLIADVQGPPANAKALSIANQGGGASHNNLPPYLVGNVLIKL